MAHTRCMRIPPRPDATRRWSRPNTIQEDDGDLREHYIRMQRGPLKRPSGLLEQRFLQSLYVVAYHKR